MADYLKDDVVARAEALGLKARSIVEGMRVGDHKSPYRGFSVEFVQHREYVPGDDLRHIDWRSYGRSERYTIKQYEQETNFIGHVLVDASKSMLYGDGDSNKLEYAKVLASCLAYVIVQQRDMVSLNIFDSAWRERLPPSGQLGHVQTILATLGGVDAKEKNNVGPLLHELAGGIRRRGLVFLISDCFDDLRGLIEGLQHLRFQGHEIVVFHVMHPDELDFPFDGMVKFDALEDVQHVLTRPRQIRTGYMRALQEFLVNIRQECERNRMDYILMNTGRPLSVGLTEYLARRLRVRMA